MSVCLPFDVHLKILDYLDVSDIREYSLVCKKWHGPANYTLFKSVTINVETELDTYVDALDTYLASRRYTKTLTLRMSPRYECWSSSLMDKRAKQYATLIRHMPDVQTLIIKESAKAVPGVDIKPDYITNLEAFPLRHEIDPLYQVVSQAISDGLWQSLCHICDEFFMTKNIYTPLFGLVPERCIHPDYYKTLSAIREQATYVGLNITSITNSLLQPHCLSFPDFITKDTRFPKARELDCYSSKKATIRGLDDVLELCPAATKVFIDLREIQEDEHKPVDINPNRIVRSLKIYIFKYTEEFLDYIYQKFPHVVHFELHVREDRTIISNQNLCKLPARGISQLVNYLRKTNTFNISHQFLSNQMEVLEAFSGPQWQSRLHVSLPYFYIGICESRQNSTVNLFKKAVEFDHTPNISAFLNQLDTLNIIAETIESPDAKIRSYAHIMQSCKQLRVLELKNFTLTDFPELVLPAVDLKIRNCKLKPEVWTHISRNMPNLNNILYVIDWRECFKRRLSLDFVVEVDMPFTSINRFVIGKMPTLAGPGCYVKLTQSTEKGYWTNIGKNGLLRQLCSIEPSEYEQKKQELQFPILNLTCKDMKSFWQIV